LIETRDANSSIDMLRLTGMLNDRSEVLYQMDLMRYAKDT
jgi:hypothetical protein